VPRLSLSKLLERLSTRPSDAVVFLHGDEDYLRERALRAIVDLLLDPSTRDFNYDQLRGTDATPETLSSLTATPPMMAEHRLVVVRDAQGLSPKARESVESALARPTPGVVLILSTAIPSGSKAKFYDTLVREALSVEFPAVEPQDLPEWLLEYVREFHGIEMDLDAARALGTAIGSQLGVLATEIEKAVAFIGDRQRITIEDVRAVGGYLPRVDRWGWFDKVGERRFREALSELEELLDSGETAVGLVLGLAGQLLKVGIAVDGGRDALERALKPNQRWLASRVTPQARRWTAVEIDRALADLLRTDRLLKSASLTDRQAMEELLLRLAAGDSRAELPLAGAVSRRG
jgi:DNA polymerase III subunit delta